MQPKSHRCPVLRLLLPLVGGYAAAEFLPAGFFVPALAAGGALAFVAAWLVREPPLRASGRTVGIEFPGKIRSGVRAVAARVESPRGIDRGDRAIAARVESPREIRSRLRAFGWGACFSVAVFCLAFAYYQHRKNHLPEWDELPPREAELEFRVERLFASPLEGRMSGIGRVVEAPLLLAELEGKRIHFSFAENPEAPAPTRTARMRARGLLEPLDPGAAGDGFQRFLLRSGIQFRFGRGPPPETTRPARAFFRFCRERREVFAHHLRAGSEPGSGHAGVYVAMLLGERQALDAERRAAFLQTGTLHLFAISGLHIGVIAFALHTVLTILRIPPLPAAAIGLPLLLLYVEITGGAPSAVRAFIMVAFFWSSSLFARPANPVSALACSATCVLLLFPHQLWNAGFQLSYTVVTAILLLGLPLAEHWTARCQPFGWLPPDVLGWRHRAIRSVLAFLCLTGAVSLTATLASSPLSIHYFNLFTPGAVLLNMILVPLASLVISAGMLALVTAHAGLLPLTVLFNHAAWMVIVVMDASVALWCRFPAHFWEAEFRADYLAGATTAAVLGSILLYAERAGRPLWINAALPFLILGLLLVLGVRLTFPA